MVKGSINGGSSKSVSTKSVHKYYVNVKTGALFHTSKQNNGIGIVGIIHCQKVDISSSSDFISCLSSETCKLSSDKLYREISEKEFKKRVQIRRGIKYL